MEKLGLILAFVALLPGLFFTVANITGNSGVFKFIFRLLGIGTTVLSIIYILKYFSVV